MWTGGNGSGRFIIRIGGVDYTAYYNSSFKFYESFWGGAPNDYSYFFTSYPLSWWNWWSSYVNAHNVKYKYSLIDNNTHEIWLTAMATEYTDSWGWGYPLPSVLDGSPNPLTMEIFKGYLYAGFGNGKLRRTSDFSDYTNYGTWEDCGLVQAPDNNNINRTQPYAITTLGKTSFKDNTGTMQDVNLYIGGAQGSSPNSTGFGALFFTQGLNSNGADAVPLKYQILEDEWKYTKTSNTAVGSAYRSQIYDFYGVYPGLLGLVVSFCASTTRPLADGFGSTWNQRKVHTYNAPPSCEINVNPEPVINERGTDSDVNFQFITIGGYGPGNGDKLKINI